MLALKHMITRPTSAGVVVRQGAIVSMRLCNDMPEVFKLRRRRASNALKQGYYVVRLLTTHFKAHFSNAIDQVLSAQGPM